MPRSTKQSRSPETIPEVAVPGPAVFLFGPGVAPYASSVPDTAYHPRRQLRIAPVGLHPFVPQRLPPARSLSASSLEDGCEGKVEEGGGKGACV
eukprot:3907414-Rhodomonas_salina.1